MGHYLEFIKSAKLNKIRCKVKVADITGNLGVLWIDNITEKDIDRRHRYKAASLALKE
jgi:hypothetical protein